MSSLGMLGNAYMNQAMQRDPRSFNQQPGTMGVHAGQSTGVMGQHPSFGGPPMAGNIQPMIQNMNHSMGQQGMPFKPMTGGSFGAPNQMNPQGLTPLQLAQNRDQLAQQRINAAKQQGTLSAPGMPMPPQTFQNPNQSPAYQPTFNPQAPQGPMGGPINSQPGYQPTFNPQQGMGPGGMQSAPGFSLPGVPTPYNQKPPSY